MGVAAVIVISCSVSTGSSPTVASVNPSFAYLGEEVDVEIAGDGFALDPTQDMSCGGSPITIDDGFDGALGATALDDVVWMDDRTLVARVPATLAVGVYDLTVETPGGEVATLVDAFEVRVPGSDTDTDTDTDTDADVGAECGSAVVVEAFPFTWNGAWADFYSSFVPTNECGSGDADVWFAAQIPGGAVALRVTDLSATDVLIRHVESCADSACINYTDEPEVLEIPGGPLAATAYVVITEIDGAAHPDGEVLFELLY
jgi:hypothetical protein